MFFEHLAKNDDTAQKLAHKASVLANTRVRNKFSRFLDAATTVEDRAARIALVTDEIRETVAAACEEVGHAGSAAVESAIFNRLGGGADHLKEYQFKPAGESDDKDDDTEEEAEDGDSKEASTKESRRPKMCPYHKELVDASLQSGQPQYNAFASLVGGAAHCQGGFEGSCNFKPSMVTQQYWDDKQAEYAQRADQRQQQQLRDAPIPEAMPQPPSAADQDAIDRSEGSGVTNINSELEQAPSAVGGGLSEPMPMAASYRVADGPTVPTDDSREKRVNLPDHKNDTSTGLSGEPSPKMDKGTWKPNVLNEEGNLSPIKSEGPGSPNPTKTQDIKQIPDHTIDPLKQTDAVAEHGVKLPKAGDDGYSTERNISQPHTNTWSGTDGLADPVTNQVQSAKSVDPDKNPIRDILESGFVPQGQAQQLIASYKKRAWDGMDSGYGEQRAVNEGMADHTNPDTYHDGPCINCGTPIAPGEPVCHHCGTPVHQQPHPYDDAGGTPYGDPGDPYGY